MSMRKQDGVSRRAAMIGAAATGAMVSVGAGSQGRPVVNLQPGWLLSGNQLGEVAAKHMGVYAQEGIELRFQAGGPSTPDRAMLPRKVDGLLGASRHYSAAEGAQKLSREIPPCMSGGQFAGVAAALALEAGIRVKAVDPAGICAKVRAQGDDPGDRPSANARLLARAAE